MKDLNCGHYQYLWTSVLKIKIKTLGTEVTEHLFRDIACGKLSLLMRYS